ncbi:MAG TPA: hypothetical protein VHE10_03155 [Candidatus Paceibacterota bacterium]|nr:hypothetical protein [Candidatus Paceibacterota bacterium]
MSKNPFYNAAVAGGYIALIFLGLNWVGENRFQGPETVLIPMGMVSLVTLSVALMGYLFFYQPAILLVDGKKKEALNLFLKTVGAFAVITIIYLSFALWLAR